MQFQVGNVSIHSGRIDLLREVGTIDSITNIVEMLKTINI